MMQPDAQPSGGAFGSGASGPSWRQASPFNPQAAARQPPANAASAFAPRAAAPLAFGAPSQPAAAPFQSGQQAPRSAFAASAAAGRPAFAGRGAFGASASGGATAFGRGLQEQPAGGGVSAFGAAQRATPSFPAQPPHLSSDSVPPGFEAPSFGGPQPATAAWGRGNTAAAAGRSPLQQTQARTNAFAAAQAAPPVRAFDAPAAAPAAAGNAFGAAAASNAPTKSGGAFGMAAQAAQMLYGAVSLPAAVRWGGFNAAGKAPAANSPPSAFASKPAPVQNPFGGSAFNAGGFAATSTPALPVRNAFGGAAAVAAAADSGVAAAPADAGDAVTAGKAATPPRRRTPTSHPAPVSGEDAGTDGGAGPPRFIGHRRGAVAKGPGRGSEIVFPGAASGAEAAEPRAARGVAVDSDLEGALAVAEEQRRARRADESAQVTSQRKVEWTRKVAALNPALQEAAKQDGEIRGRLPAAEAGAALDAAAMTLQATSGGATAAVPFTFSIELEDDELDELAELDNPPGAPPQNLIGTCDDMCPAEEVRDRLAADNFTRLERVERPDGSYEPRFAMKLFTRTLAGDADAAEVIDIGNIGPDRFRTKLALAQTMRHIRAWMDGVRGPDPPWCTRRHDTDDVSLFGLASDRHRSVRQDLRVQHVQSAFAASVLEEMFRFLVMGLHSLCDEPKYKDTFGIDRQQLGKTMISLNEIYDLHQQVNSPLDSEAEFRAYGVLLKTGFVDQQRYRDLSNELPFFLPQLSPDVLGAPEVRWALEVSRAVRQNNCPAFFALVRQGTYIQACLCHLLFFEEMRKRQVEALHVSGPPKGSVVPLTALRDMLLLENVAAVMDWLAAYNPIYSLDAKSRACLVLTRVFSDNDGKLNLSRRSRFVDSKAAGLKRSALMVGRLSASASTQTTSPRRAAASPRASTRVRPAPATHAGIKGAAPPPAAAAQAPSAALDSARTDSATAPVRQGSELTTAPSESPPFAASSAPGATTPERPPLGLPVWFASTGAADAGGTKSAELRDSAHAGAPPEVEAAQGRAEQARRDSEAAAEAKRVAAAEAAEARRKAAARAAEERERREAEARARRLEAEEAARIEAARRLEEQRKAEAARLEEERRQRQVWRERALAEAARVSDLAAASDASGRAFGERASANARLFASALTSSHRTLTRLRAHLADSFAAGVAQLSAAGGAPSGTPPQLTGALYRWDDADERAAAARNVPGAPLSERSDDLASYHSEADAFCTDPPATPLGGLVPPPGFDVDDPATDLPLLVSPASAARSPPSRRGGGAEPGSALAALDEGSPALLPSADVAGVARWGAPSHLLWGDDPTVVTVRPPHAQAPPGGALPLAHTGAFKRRCVDADVGGDDAVAALRAALFDKRPRVSL